MILTTPSTATAGDAKTPYCLATSGDAIFRFVMRTSISLALSLDAAFSTFSLVRLHLLQGGSGVVRWNKGTSLL